MGVRRASRYLLQAETLRKDEAAELDDDAAGDAGFARAASCGDAPLSPSWEASSKERLRPVIRAHGRMAQCQRGPSRARSRISLLLSAPPHAPQRLLRAEGSKRR